MRLGKLDRGVHQVKAQFTPSGETVTGSTSQNDWVWIVF
ncbi:hypothetical protein ADILRU_1374 [Leifsonia rubra CMS 76R]|nr:hypothetical protein ADILRU_1374 [Leifsonia rubra CMS 76R]